MSEGHLKRIKATVPEPGQNEADAPAPPQPPPRAVISDQAEVDPLSGLVSPASGLHRKYEKGRPTP